MGKIYFCKMKETNALFWWGSSNLNGWSIHYAEYYANVDAKHCFEAD